MPETAAPQLNAAKVKALELANQHNASHAEVVARAGAYHAFLTDNTGIVPKSAGGSAPNAGASNGAAANKNAAGAQAPKPGANAAPKNNTAPKNNAVPKNNAAPKGAAAAGGAAQKGATANKPAPQTAQGAPQAEGLVLENVSAALQKVLNFGVDPNADRPTQQAQHEVGKKAAYKILNEAGDAKAVRDVKPSKYRVVIDACEAYVKAAGAGAEADSGDADFEAGPSETPISADDDAIDTDPPEHTGGGADAEDL